MKQNMLGFGACWLQAHTSVRAAGHMRHRKTCRTCAQVQAAEMFAAVSRVLTTCELELMNQADVG
jgi:hypothetical protein